MRHLLVLALFLPLMAASAQPRAERRGAGTAVLRDFRFANGDTLSELRVHYVALGQPRRDARGTTRNAVLVLHGTGGTGQGFLSRTFAGELFGPGKLLDTARYYVILPDGIGHGRSSKPSDGRRARFPRYTYDDMVAAQHRLLTEHLDVDHLRLIMGTSMGCMHAWVWGYTHPNFADGLVPLACLPTQIAGRNRMLRTMLMDDIRTDPAWKGGEYTEPPPGLRAALQILFVMSSAPLVQQAQGPTREAADSVIRTWLEQRMKTTDANDLLYAVDASREYDPSSRLERITAPVLFINSHDDLLNPPELGIAERLAARVPRARFINLPISPATRGHGTHSLPAIWGPYLEEFLRDLPER
ncbi:MAG: alpha/beta fold hydrolase [Gemmatimonadaceae bacterium]|jgi:homoserine O-acetyltransferase|nr:alpha/beta fold hydrolase [Gemmatimonadaceae bacterium]